MPGPGLPARAGSGFCAAVRGCTAGGTGGCSGRDTGTRSTGAGRASVRPTHDHHRYYQPKPPAQRVRAWLPPRLVRPSTANAPTWQVPPMGNSCTKSESQVVQSHGRWPRRPSERGRWSVPEQTESVDLDELLAAPSPPARRRKKYVNGIPKHGGYLRWSPSVEKKKRSKSRKRSKSKRTIEENEPVDLDAVLAGEVKLDKRAKEREKKEKKKRAKEKKKMLRSKSKLKGKSKNADEEEATYNSYEDPGYLAAVPIEMTHFDSDLILGSPLNSPSVIHARWGEPVDDPDEVSMCQDFQPNPFKLGFCVNCQKQHDVTTNGDVVAQKNYKKIARPAVAKTAASALDNPAALQKMAQPSNTSRESDVDLALLLRQRRDILMKLNKLDQEKARRKELSAAAAVKSGYGHLRRMAATSGPQSYRVSRGTSFILSPKPTPLIGISKSISLNNRPIVNDDEPELTPAEEELLTLLKERGVPSICDSISHEINYVWAVISGFRTLASVGNFYFACGSQAFGYNPALDFFGCSGLQLALFTLQKFVHNENVLVPVLDCINIYCKLYVEGSVEFLAVQDSKEILMKCVRFHDNKPQVIAAACQALGSLVMNDLVRDYVSSPELVTELLHLIRRYHRSLVICRGALVPLPFLVPDASITAAFVDANGIAVTMSTMKHFIKDTELVWHAIGVLNGLNAQTIDFHLVHAVFGCTGVPRIVEALASHVDTEEIAVEGFQLLQRIAAIPEAYRAINQAKVLDLAYVAVFAYSGTQHKHTRLQIKRTLTAFQKCTLYDKDALAEREQPTRTDIVLFALFLICFLLSCALSVYDANASMFSAAVRRQFVDNAWLGPSYTGITKRALPEVNSADDMWNYLLGTFQAQMFRTKWYNGEPFARDVESQLGMVDRGHVLLGGVQLRQLRVKKSDCTKEPHLPNILQASQSCYPPYAASVERKDSINTTGFYDHWAASAEATSPSLLVAGTLGDYADVGYRQFLPRVSLDGSCDAKCQLTKLRDVKWLDQSTRALLVEFNLYSAADDVHCSVTILCELSAAGGAIISTRLSSIHLDQYPTLFIFTARFYMEIGVLVGFLWFARKQLVKLGRYGLFYFVVWSHVLDFVMCGFWVACIIVRLLTLAAASHSLVVALRANDSFVDMRSNGFLLRCERQLMAACAVMMWYRFSRLAQHLAPLKKTLKKVEQAENLIVSYLVLLAVFLLAFGQIGYVLFAPQMAHSSTYLNSIVHAARGLVKRWGTANTEPTSREIAFKVIFQLAALMILLNIIVTIMRERFTHSEKPNASTRDLPETMSVVDLAKRQLQSSGLEPEEKTVAKRLQQAATHGLQRIQQTAMSAFAITNKSLNLSDLRQVWGLEDLNPAEKKESSVERYARLLDVAQEVEDELDQRLAYMTIRLHDTMNKLEQLRAKRLRAHSEPAEDSKIMTPSQYLLSAMPRKPAVQAKVTASPPQSPSLPGSLADAPMEDDQSAPLDSVSL
ncbi:TPA: hypothetical protein N0F65_012540 [Lagenidium giganteum]|uniref:Polycystin cation channel PKD1/PKD2 domain-containing protein n=1 Tax=Lagenidium giganteum TaxID=4803 RepID=A0AAV2YN11_9STRA|nr:TPA: hypothetical protein N0F65_012540 [Lagenidium giganteum]